MDKLTNDLGQALKEWLAAYDDGYDASCENGEDWNGGSWISDCMLAENAKTLIARWERARTAPISISETDLLSGYNPGKILSGQARGLVSLVTDHMHRLPEKIQEALRDRCVVVRETCNVVDRAAMLAGARK